MGGVDHGVEHGLVAGRAAGQPPDCLDRERTARHHDGRLGRRAIDRHVGERPRRAVGSQGERDRREIAGLGAGRHGDARRLGLPAVQVGAIQRDHQRRGPRVERQRAVAAVRAVGVAQRHGELEEPAGEALEPQRAAGRLLEAVVGAVADRPAAVGPDVERLGSGAGQREVGARDPGEPAHARDLRQHDEHVDVVLVDAARAAGDRACGDQPARAHHRPHASSTAARP
jgi:hypothetical protein